MNELAATIRPLITSHSIDNVFDYCARKFEFLTLYDKRPPRDSGFAAEVGTALHDATQAWAVARAEGHTENAARESGYITLLKRYPWELAESEVRDTRSIETCIIMLEQIFDDPSWDDYDLVKVGNRWAVEVPFLIRHESMGTFKTYWGQEVMLVTQGKIDFILRHRITHIYRTRDLKTTVFNKALEEAEWKFSGQQIGYSNVLWAMLEVPPDNMEVDYLVAHFNGSSELPSVHPLTIRVNQDLIDDYWLTKQERLNKMKVYAESNRFPRTNGGCHSWGHPCPFLQICETRDYDLIQGWFSGINPVPQEGYDYWVTLGV